MSVYVNCSNDNFVNDQDQFYQDKTLLIMEMNKLLDLNSQKFICVTRPRRFGKSMAINMLNAYYSKGCDSKYLFENKKLSQHKIFKASGGGIKPFRELVSSDQSLDSLKNNDERLANTQVKLELEGYLDHLNKYDVIKIDFNDLSTLYTQAYQSGSLPIDEMYKESTHEGRAISIITYLQMQIINELREIYPDLISDEYKYQLKEVLIKLNQTRNLQFIFLIDEWDLVFRDQPYVDDLALKEQYVSFLRGLFKDGGTMPLIKLAYITGILPIQKYNSESSLNNFTEYSMLSPSNLAPYYGFTEKEVEELCVQYSLDFAAFTKWYDGYILNDIHIYNPYSVVNAIKSGFLGNYWTKTSASNIAYDYIFGKKPLIDQKGKDGAKAVQRDLLQLLIGKEIRADLSTFSGNPSDITTVNELFSLLVCLGYITFSGSGTVALKNSKLKIPNLEIRLALKNEFLLHEYANKTQGKRIKALAQISQSFFDAIVAKNEKEVAQIAQSFHNNSSQFVSFKEYNDESALRFTIQMLLMFATLDHYQIEKEATSGLGYADLMLIPIEQDPELPPIILEFKMNASSEVGIEQIKQKNYKQKLRSYTNEPIYYVGISYDLHSKQHDCTILVDKS